MIQAPAESLKSCRSIGGFPGFQTVSTLAFVHKSKKRQIWKSSLYGTNRYGLEAHAVARRDGSAELVPHDLESSLDAQESNVA